METTFVIPILSRGRVIMPSENDSIEFPGRNGARFRSPDPRQHIHDLVLADAGKLQDLHDMPVAGIIDFLACLGERLTMDNPYLQASFELALKAGGLTEPVLRRIYLGIPYLFRRSILERSIDETIGIPFVDGWVPMGTAGAAASIRLRAVGTRQLHITAGNVPIVASLTVIRAALTKSDCLIKAPSNDPLTASAIVQTMIDLDPTHPVTKHFAVAYWKGGDQVMDSEIIRTSRIDKITAWGGMASMQHIQKFLVPGLDLVSMNPKFSISLIGREALDNAQNMRDAATGVAVLAGKFNQTACASTRIVYVESDTDDDSLDKLNQFGQRVYDALQALPPEVSTPAARPNPELEAELDAIRLEDDFYWVKGNTVTGGVVVSRVESPVDFSNSLNNRIVNIVPLTDLSQMFGKIDDQTQTVGVYPMSLQDRLRDQLAMRGVQRIVPLGPELVQGDAVESGEVAGLPHDGQETMRRMVRWVIDQLPFTPKTFNPPAT